MKRFVLPLCAALLAVSCTACSMVSELTQQLTEQTETAYFVYSEAEYVDDTYAASFVFNLPDGYIKEYGIATRSLDAALPTLFADAMCAKPYGVGIGTVTLHGGKTAWDNVDAVGEDNAAYWTCTAESSASGYEFYAEISFNNAAAFLDWLRRCGSEEGALGTRTFYSREGSESASLYAAGTGYRDDRAYYRVSGRSLKDPMQGVMNAWKEGYEGGETAFSDFWNGTDGAGGMKALIDKDAFDALNGILCFAYQFVSPAFNGSNGQYERSSGMRSAIWGFELDGTVYTTSEARIYLQSPRLWLWYLTGVPIVVAFGVALFFILRNAEKQRQRLLEQQSYVRSQQPPNVPPFRGYGGPNPPPGAPFDGYGDPGSSAQGGESPFGSDYENKDKH